MGANPVVQDLHEEFLRSVNDAIDRMTLTARETPHPTPERQRARYRKLVVAYDGSEGAKLALAWAKEIAGLHGSEVIIANTFAPVNIGGASIGYGWYADYTELYEKAEKWARSIADETASELRAVEIKAKAYTLEGSAGTQIAKLAREQHADLLLIGASRHSAVGRLFLGSSAMSLVEQAPCSVLVARNSPPIRRMLVATDGSNVSYRAVAHALGIASELNAELVVEHVLEYPEQAEELHPEGLLKNIIKKIQLPAAPPRVRYLMDVGNPATRILHRAREEDVGLIVVGSHGRGVVERMFVGSVSRRVTNESGASVWVVKEAGR
jgi:nucleotide-binding universal stress UspA family protein